MLPFGWPTPPSPAPEHRLVAAPKHEWEHLLHKATIALLAAPIHAAAGVGAILRRSILVRVSLAVGLAVILGIVVVAVGRPAPTVATAPTAIVPLAQGTFTTEFATNRAVTEPVRIVFSAPMDATSVAASIRVDPETPVDLAWNDEGTELTVAPATAWAAGVLHTVTIEPGVLARSGQPMMQPARAVFLTRSATAATAAVTASIGGRVALGSAFVVSFTRPVDMASVAAGIRLDPPTDGTVQAVAMPGEASGGPIRFAFVPDEPLDPDQDYQLIVSGVRDADGLALDPVRLEIQTIAAPSVVRFRPRDDTNAVGRDSVLSVRFSERMDRRSTARAFIVKVGGRAVPGTVQWAEHDTVLVFTPKARLPAAAAVSMDVTTSARSVAGVPIAKPDHGAFRTARAGAGTTYTASDYRNVPAIGGGSWADVETYYLGLMNCTRTGGWVTSTGHCNSPGGRNVAPLRLDQGISSKVSRPYARRLAIGADCSHFIGGNPGDRLRNAGYMNYTWAENIGCRSGGARAAVLGSHLFFQSEKSYNGGHYVNMMNPKYDRVGIGVWVSGGRVRLVIDFYHP